MAAQAQVESSVTSDAHRDVAASISHMEALQIEELRTMWRRVFRRRPGPGLNRTLLVRMLAYQLQVDAFGDFDAATQAVLDRLSAKLAGGDFVGPLVPPLPTSALQSGTTLVREWKGRFEHVIVMNDGFAWNGQVWRSLSEVAKRITGVSWNGWTFFGLKTAGQSGNEGGKASTVRPDASLCASHWARRTTGDESATEAAPSRADETKASCARQAKASNAGDHKPRSATPGRPDPLARGTGA